MTKVDVLVVGAGVSGLATAAALGPGAKVVVLEREAAVGGYCKTVRQAGFTWDYSGHFFHFRRPQIEAWLRARMGSQGVRTVNKQSFVRYAGRDVDFPFQKNIHQLPAGEYAECLRDLEEADRAGASGPFESFQQMLYARYGKGICEKFLIPYNEKLYATDLGTLEVGAMGRFFPHASPREIIENAKEPDNSSYNQTFTYPEGGAIEYVKALQSAVAPDAVRLNTALVSVSLARRVATTTAGDFEFGALVSSAPFPALLRACALPYEPAVFSWNKVLVFNLGFDAKGPRGVHWMYFPDRRRAFYRVGFYDNIFDSDRMSLYVELGLRADEQVDVPAARARVLEDLESEGLVTGQKLVAEHHVVMDPAYVHITKGAIAARGTLGPKLEAGGVYSIGRYGGWTYCSIEDNIVEAAALAKKLGGPVGAFGL